MQVDSLLNRVCTMRHLFFLSLFALPFPAKAETPLQTQIPFCGEGIDLHAALSPGRPMRLTPPQASELSIARLCDRSQSSASAPHADFAAMDPLSSNIKEPYRCVTF